MDKLAKILGIVFDYVRKNSSVIFLIIIIILLLLVSFFLNRSERYKSMYETEKCNVSALKSDVDSFRIVNGKLVVKTFNQAYTIDELKEYYEKELELAKKSGVKTKTIEKVINETTYVTLEDTVYLQGTAQDYYGTYTDGYTDMEFQITGEELSFSLKFKDSQTVFVSYEKDKFSIFHPFRKRNKRYVTTVVSDCPYATHISRTVSVK